MGEAKKPKGKGKRRARGRKIRRAVLCVALLAAAPFALRAYVQSRAQSESETQTLTRAVVRRGPMTQTVYGTGTTSARSQPNLLAETDGTLTELRVSVGDEVKAGDVIAVLTNEELDDTITDLEFQLWDLDGTIADTVPGTSVRTIDAPVAGRVAQIFAAEGDDALAVFRREGALAVLSTDGRMRVELTELSAADGVALGERVRVAGDGFEAEGTVTDVTRQGTQATVTVIDDTLPVGAAVAVTRETGETLGEGALAINKPMAVSSYGGTISSVRVSVGDKVARGATLFRLEDSPLTLAIENLRIQREAAAKELEDAKERRENLIVLAPCDGVVASLAVSEGDEITAGTLLGSILEGEEMNLTIAVDELDVVKVEPGQSVAVTVDALGDEQLTGTVRKIAPVGSGSGGVTSYSVELELSAAGSGVRSGMNATGEITVASVEDALYVPVEALMTVANRTYVTVEGAATTSAMAGPAGLGSERNQGGESGLGGGNGSDGAETGGLPGPGGESAQNGEGSPDSPNGPDGTEMGGLRGAGGESSPDNASSPNSQSSPDGAQAGESRGAARNGAERAAQGGAGTRRRANAAETSGETSDEAGGEEGLLTKAQSAARGLYARFVAWLYDGVNEDAPTGALVPVETGLQNDDYVQILSGVSEGDTVLYTASETQSGFSFSMGGMGGMSMGGAPGGMPGGPGGR